MFWFDLMTSVNGEDDWRHSPQQTTENVVAYSFKRKKPKTDVFFMLDCYLRQLQLFLFIIV